MGRRPWWAVLCAAGAIALLWVPSWTNPLTDPTAATWLLAIVSLVVAGWASLGRRSQRGNGTLMLIIAVAASATQLQYVTVGPWAFLGTMLYPFIGVLVGLLLLRWPGHRLQTRAQRWLIRTAFILVPVLTAADSLTWDPAWGGFTGPYWWPTLVHREDLGNRLYNGTQGFEAILLLAFVALVVTRIVRASRPERRELVPVALAATAFATLAVASLIGALTNTDVGDVATWASNLSLLAVPVAFLISLAVRRIQRALAVEALLDPQRLTASTRSAAR
jgi:MFS family permease